MHESPFIISVSMVFIKLCKRMMFMGPAVIMRNQPAGLHLQIH